MTITVSPESWRMTPFAMRRLACNRSYPLGGFGAVSDMHISAARVQNAKTALAQAENRARAILAKETKNKSLKGLYFGRFGHLGSAPGTAQQLYSGARGAVAGATTGAAVGAGIVTGAVDLGLTTAATTAATAGGAAAAGATFGSVVPIVGTAIGAIVGILASGVLSSRPDPENANFDQAIQIYHAQGPQGIYNIADKYLVLAGLFDLHPNQVHGNNIWYKKYGRMGEHKFVTDMMNVIYSAEKAGRITTSDTPQSVYSNIVVPWFNSWGMGQFSDPNGAMLQAIVIGMIAEYVAGMQSAWRDVNGNYTFRIPTFILPIPTRAPTTNVSAAIPGAASAAPSLPAGVAQVGTDPSTGAPIYAEASTGTQYEYVNGQFVPYQPTGITAAGVPTTGGISANTLSLIQSLLAQGQSQQRAYNTALSSLASQGVNTQSPAVQSQLAQAVQNPTAAASALGIGGATQAGMSPVEIGLLLAAGVGILFFGKKSGWNMLGSKESHKGKKS